MGDLNRTPTFAAALDLWRELIEQAEPRLRMMTDSRTEARPAPGKWSKKELLGHLIDSASNNHQRFVRAQLEPESVFPGYAQNLWVDAQQYQLRPWRALVDFWVAYNRHLLHVASRIPEDRWNHSIDLAGQRLTLVFLVIDYVRHLEQHLQQVMEHPSQDSTDPILEVRGAGKQIGADEGGHALVARERDGWEEESANNVPEPPSNL